MRLLSRESMMLIDSWRLPEHLTSAARRIISMYSQFSRPACVTPV